MGCSYRHMTPFSFGQEVGTIGPPTQTCKEQSQNTIVEENRVSGVQDNWGLRIRCVEEGSFNNRFQANFIN